MKYLLLVLLSICPVLAQYSGPGGGYSTGGTLPSIANNDLLANTSGVIATPSGVTLSGYLDSVFGNTVGETLCRASGGWSVTAPAGSNNIPFVGQIGNRPIYGGVNLAGGSSFVFGILPVPNGGSGVGTLATHGILIGEGTSAFTALSPVVDSVPLWQSATADPVATALVNCANDGAHAEVYSTTSHTFACSSINAGTGYAGPNNQTANYLGVSGDTGKLITMTGTSL